MGTQCRNLENRCRHSTALTAVTWLEGLCRSQKVVGIIIKTALMGIIIKMAKKYHAEGPSKETSWALKGEGKQLVANRTGTAWRELTGACLGHSHGNTRPLEGK